MNRRGTWKIRRGSWKNAQTETTTETLDSMKPSPD
jgi:hypothetical protein